MLYEIHALQARWMPSHTMLATSVLSGTLQNTWQEMLREAMGSTGVAGEVTCPATVVSYGPTTMRMGDTFRPCGWTLTPVAEREIRVGPTLIPCVCETTLRCGLQICPKLEQRAPQYHTAPRKLLSCNLRARNGSAGQCWRREQRLRWR